MGVRVRVEREEEREARRGGDQVCFGERRGGMMVVGGGSEGLDGEIRGGR